MKKSNNLGGRTGAPQGNRMHWVGIPTNRNGEYIRIKSHTLALDSAHGRASAINYLQLQRPWLTEYVRPAELPASGTLLDGWKRQASSGYL
jgi:hypothetical protein